MTLLRRAAAVVAAGLRHAALPWLRQHPPLSWLGGPPPTAGPIRLRAALEELGGVFVKLGQLLALQPDVLPRVYCNALFDLMDQLAPFSFVEVERRFRDDYGHSPDDLFDHFDRRALSTASIGQVHRAVLGGREVAVKVQRPDAARQFGADLRLIALLARLIRRFRLRRLYPFLDPFDELVDWTDDELDYRCEARAMQQIGELAAQNPRARVPKVAWEVTSRLILTAEFLDGVSVLDLLRSREAGDTSLEEALVARGFDPDTLARNVVATFLEDAFLRGVYHADLHPANLLILPDNQVGYVDFGIAGYLSPHARRGLVRISLAFARGDAEELMDAFLSVARRDEGSDVPAFRRELVASMDHWYGADRRLRQSFTRMFADMLNLSRRYGVWPQRGVIKYVRSVVAADGLLGRLAPGLDLGALIEETCGRVVTVRALRESLAPQRLLDGIGATARLLERGPERLVGALSELGRDRRDEKVARSAEAAGGSTVWVGAVSAVIGAVAIHLQRIVPWQPVGGRAVALALVVAGSLLVAFGRRGAST